jgi:hypothetical protein
METTRVLHFAANGIAGHDRSTGLIGVQHLERYTSGLQLIHRLIHNRRAAACATAMLRQSQR